MRHHVSARNRLPEPLFTPATKAESGHDENISFDEMSSRIGTGLAERLRELTLGIYSRAAAYAASRGIIIADTKFEFGIAGGEILLIDEVLTPDSSRFWPAESYAPGSNPPSYDKQFVRDWLESTGWDKTPPAPELPQFVVERTQAKYLEAYRQLTRQEIDLTQP
jgi:phosphoribosylaminoimidazole-succinocarboxamide synthase